MANEPRYSPDPDPISDRVQGADPGNDIDERELAGLNDWDDETAKEQQNIIDPNDDIGNNY